MQLLVRFPYYQIKKILNDRRASLDRLIEEKMNTNWKLIVGFLFSITGLFLIVYNQLLVHGVFGRIITGIILIILGILIILLKKERLHYAFFIASILTFIKMIEGLHETDMKIAGFIAGDIAMILFLVVLGVVTYYLEKKHG